MANYIQNYNGGVQFKTGASQGLTVDIDGNVGVGIINSTWYSTIKPIQISTTASVSGSASGYANFANNFYVDSAGVNRYLTNSYINLLQIDPSGNYNFYTAPSGIAGATTTITSGQAYTVTALSSTTLAQWQSFFSGLSVLPTVGQSITATATGTLLGGATVTQVASFSNALKINSSGIGIGTLSPLAKLSVVGKTHINAIGGTAKSNNYAIDFSNAQQSAGIDIVLSSPTTFLDLYAGGDSANNGGWNGAIRFFTGGTNQSGIERARIDASGNLLLNSGTGALGYGTGAGGTVTQLTSKSTAVTLNKPVGNIITSNSSLSAGTSATFILNNSILSGAVDQLIVSINNNANHKVEVQFTYPGVAYIKITNISGGAVSEAVYINFLVVKGVNA